MICLGIESSAYALAVGIINDKREILANIIYNFKPLKGMGLIPRDAAEEYSKKVYDILTEAFDNANLKPENIDLIAVTIGPGIGHCLRVGISVAKYLALRLKKPIVGVNHCIAHLEVAKMYTGFKDPLMLYVSGGNTQIITYKDGKYRVIGETLDIGIGNLLDVVAREMGYDMPGGPKIEKLAKEGKNYIEIPYTVKGIDLTFGGILTYVKNLIKSGK